MIVKNVPQVKIFNNSNSQVMETEINEFCESHEIAQIQYFGISMDGIYSCMVIYIESHESDIDSEFSDHAQSLLDSIRTPMPEIRKN